MIIFIFVLISAAFGVEIQTNQNVSVGDKTLPLTLNLNITGIDATKQVKWTCEQNVVKKEGENAVLTCSGTLQDKAQTTTVVTTIITTATVSDNGTSEENATSTEIPLIPTTENCTTGNETGCGITPSKETVPEEKSSGNQRKVAIGVVVSLLVVTLVVCGVIFARKKGYTFANLFGGRRLLDRTGSESRINFEQFENQY